MYFVPVVSVIEPSKEAFTHPDPAAPDQERAGLVPTVFLAVTSVGVPAIDQIPAHVGSVVAPEGE